MQWLIIFRLIVGVALGGTPIVITLFAEFVPSAQRGRWLLLMQSFWTIGEFASDIAHRADLGVHFVSYHDMVCCNTSCAISVLEEQFSYCVFNIWSMSSTLALACLFMSYPSM